MPQAFTHPSCPTCAKAGRHLSESSENAHVDYYRCDACGHVWTISKLLGTSRDVTILAEGTDETVAGPFPSRTLSK